MGHVPALDEPTQHALDDRTQRAVLLGEALGVHAEELLDVLLDQAEMRRGSVAPLLGVLGGRRPDRAGGVRGGLGGSRTGSTGRVVTIERLCPAHRGPLVDRGTQENAAWCPRGRHFASRWLVVAGGRVVAIADQQYGAVEVSADLSMIVLRDYLRPTPTLARRRVPWPATD